MGSPFHFAPVIVLSDRSFSWDAMSLFKIKWWRKLADKVGKNHKHSVTHLHVPDLQHGKGKAVKVNMMMIYTIIFDGPRDIAFLRHSLYEAIIV